MVAQQSRAKKGKVGNGRKSMSQSIARNNNTATQDDENVSINLILAILSTGIMAFIGILTETLTNVLFPGKLEQIALADARSTKTLESSRFQRTYHRYAILKRGNF